MPPNEKEIKEEFIFESFEENYTKPVDVESTEIIKKYKDINFEADLNEEQLEVVNNIEGPMLVLAGAGSGKTRTITYAVAKLLSLGIKPSEIMLVTFTNKAASEMISRVEELLGERPKGIWAGTFHAMGNRFLRTYSKALGYDSNYIIMDETDAKALIKSSIAEANVKELKIKFPTPAQTKMIFSFSINCNKTIQEVVSWKFPKFEKEELVMKLEEISRIYTKKKQREGLVDFDDLLLFWNRLLDEEEIAQMLAKRIKYILVDEYQDTNYIQDEIIYKLATNNPSRNVMVVGDDSQSIYAFRGADYKNILEFENKYPDCKKYHITYNYRTVSDILELANSSINHNKKQFEKQMRSTRSEGILPYRINVGNDDDQADFIADEILKLKESGIPFHEIAILYRATHHALKIEMSLQSKKIPFEVRAGVSFFERAHIKDVMAHLRLIENPLDEVAWSRVFGIVQGLGGSSGAKIYSVLANMDDPLNALIDENFFPTHLKGSRISKAGRDNLVNHIKKLIGITVQKNPTTAIKKLIIDLKEYISTKYGDWESKFEDLNQLGIYAQNFTSIQNFLENLSLNQSTLETKKVDAGIKERPVVLSTIHRAKGLEWQVVFIPMLAADVFPSAKVKGKWQALEEERRIFYVAMTRAKDQLYLVVPSRTQTYGRYQPVKPSRFIVELNNKLYQRRNVRSTHIEKESYYKIEGTTCKRCGATLKVSSSGFKCKRCNIDYDHRGEQLTKKYRSSYYDSYYDI